MPASDYQTHRRKAHGQRNGSTRDWRQIREYCLKRDGHRCTRCGSTDRLEVHHVNGNAARDDRPSQLVTLCFDCHPRLGPPT
jgi:5-methylcytosine-specific restriction endonuclease McrA